MSLKIVLPGVDALFLAVAEDGDRQRPRSGWAQD